MWCSERSMFRYSMFRVFEVRYMGVHSKTMKYPTDEWHTVYFFERGLLLNWIVNTELQNSILAAEWCTNRIIQVIQLPSYKSFAPASQEMYSCTINDYFCMIQWNTSLLTTTKIPRCVYTTLYLDEMSWCK